MQWAQINVTGGTVVATPVQQQIYQPDTILWRWMGSIAADAQGNVALGYSTSNGTAPNFPSIAVSGRLASDPPNTLPQTEVQLIAGGGSQTNICGGAPCHRWGDYTAMAVDPDGCTFWYVNEYYDTQTSGTTGNWHTRIGSFKFPSCTPVVQLAYTPVTPCRLADTRVAGGPLSPRAARAFSATLTSLIAAAGGNPAGCGIPVGPEALALTLTAVAPPLVGNLVAYADGGATPLASALNFLAGQIVANTTVVPSTSTLGPNFDIFNNSDGATPTVVDIVGYFWEYQASDCTKVTMTQAVGAGGTTDVVASCATGYVPVGGGCSTPTAGASNWLTRAGTAPGDGYHCTMLNGFAGSVNVSTDTMCCRRAGR